MDQDLNPFPDDFYFFKKKLRPTMITGEKRDKFSEKLFQKKDRLMFFLNEIFSEGKQFVINDVAI